jgi:hypothetical protein
MLHFLVVLLLGLVPTWVQACSAGKYDTGGGVCGNCPAGKYDTAAGTGASSTACLDCQAGKYSAAGTVLFRCLAWIVNVCVMMSTCRHGIYIELGTVMPLQVDRLSAPIATEALTALSWERLLPRSVSVQIARQANTVQSPVQQVWLLPPAPLVVLARIRWLRAPRPVPLPLQVRAGGCGFSEDHLSGSQFPTKHGLAILRIVVKNR